jgi:hypothetical protein
MKVRMESALPFVRRRALFALPLAALVAITGCDSHDHDDDHSEFSRVEIQTRGAAAATLAVWTPSEGWRNAQGSPISELPTPRDEPGVGLIPLKVGGPNASLTVRYFDRQGAQIQIGTLSRQAEEPRDRTCTEDEARYVPLQANTSVIAWPNIRHPSAPTGPFHWVRRPNQQVVAIFHCDHVHIYPEAAGTVEVAFVLWHVDHADGETTPIRIRVEP